MTSEHRMVEDTTITQRVSMRTISLFSVIFIFFAVGCSAPQEKESTVPQEQEKPEPETQPTEPSPEPTATVESGPSADAGPTTQQIEARVAEAEERLQATDGGKLVWQSIQAHGGLQKWFANGPISFRFNYAPVDGSARDTYQVVDQWASRAVHELASDRSIRFGWDGDTAWHTKTEGDFPMRAPRFWALTPYYFIGVPWVFGDPGVQFEKLKPMGFEGVTYDRVKVTFADGTGDAPDDYYIVFISQKDKTVGGVTYIVSYPGFFPDGGHSDPKFMSYDGAQTVGGLTFPETFRTFKLDENGKPDTLVTNTTMSDVSFKPDLAPTYFAVPEGAVVVDGM